MVGWPAFFLIVASNFVPLAGVLFWHWDVYFLMMAFWLDSVAASICVAIHTTIKGGPGAGLAVALVFALFFGFLLAIVAAAFSGHYSRKDEYLLDAIPYGFRLPGIYWAFGVSLAVHGVALIKLLSEPKAEREVDAAAFELVPFERIFLLLVVLFVAAFARRSGVPALIVLIAFKVLGDLGAAAQEHARRSRRIGTAKTDLSGAEPRAPPAETEAPAEVRGKPLSHYAGQWLIAPGESVPSGRFSEIRFAVTGAKLTARLDGAEARDVQIWGSVDRVQFIEIKVHAADGILLLRFAAQDAAGMTLTEIHEPGGDARAMQARTFSLRRA